MAISTGAKIAIGGAAALAAYFLLAGTSNASPVDPHVAGHNAGCADGTADAKAGHSPLGAADVTGSAKISAAAKASGDAVAFLDGYMTGYNECYSANAPSKVTPGPAPAPKPKPKPGAPPGADKPGAMDAYGKGCFQGAHDGYNDGLSGRGSHAHPADYPSGNPSAFAAGYRRSYSKAYDTGHFGYQAAVDAGFSPDAAAAAALDAADPTYPDTVAAGCDGYFDGWWAATAGTGGIEGFFRRIEVGGIALVGARRPRRVAQRLMPAIAVPKAHPLGWPAPPPGSSRIYRSYE